MSAMMGLGDRFAQLGESPEAVMGLMTLLAGSQARYDDHKAALDRAHADQMRAYDAHAAMNRVLVGADDAAAARYDRMAADTQTALDDLAQHLGATAGTIRGYAQTGREGTAAGALPVDTSGSDPYATAMASMRERNAARASGMDAFRRALEAPAEEAVGTRGRIGDMKGRARQGWADIHDQRVLGTIRSRPLASAMRRHQFDASTRRPRMNLMGDLAIAAGPMMMRRGFL